MCRCWYMYSQFFLLLVRDLVPVYVGCNLAAGGRKKQERPDAPYRSHFLMTKHGLCTRSFTEFFCLIQQRKLAMHLI